MIKGKKKSLKSYLKIVLQKGVDHTMTVETAEMAIAPWVRMKCPKYSIFFPSDFTPPSLAERSQ